MKVYNCPKCNEPFEFGTKFCLRCGCNLEEEFTENPVCPVCGINYQAGTTYCAADGSKLVSPDKMIPKCVICGAQYSKGVKFCTKDGGEVIPEALRYVTGINKRQEVPKYEKAGLGSRFVASVVDFLFYFLLMIPAIVFFCLGLDSANSYSHHVEAIIFFILAFVAYLMPFIYSFIKDGLFQGQSIGKKVVNIKVIKIEDSSNCTKGTSAIRALIGGLLCLIPYCGWLIEPIVVLCSSDGRRLADKAAGTMVVKA